MASKVKSNTGLHLLPPPRAKEASSNELIKTREAEDEIVDVRCQFMADSFRIHKNLLREASSHLKKQVDKAERSPTGSLSIYVHEVETTVEIFRRWLYDAPLHQRDQTQGIADEVQVLMRAHQMGVTLHASTSFMDAIMDTVIELLVEHGHSFPVGRILPKTSVIKSMNGKVRELLADWVAYGEIDDLRSDAEQLPKEPFFQRLLASAFFNRKIKGSPAPPYVTDPCHYHLHAKPEQCPSKHIDVEGGDVGMGSCQ